MANTAVVYGRKLGDRELSFEPSGALEKASLVMRDRETNSWWSLMGSKAIGGKLTGTPLTEIPLGEKTTWAKWRAQHPQSLVLSVDGVEYVASNPYEEYFTGEGTFRGLEVSDDRLAPKAPIYSFKMGETPYAVAHSTIEGGFLSSVEGAELFFYRPKGASVFQSSRAWLLPPDFANKAGDLSVLAARVEKGEVSKAVELGGFDTYWYTWVAVNPATKVLVP